VNKCGVAIVVAHVCGLIVGAALLRLYQLLRARKSFKMNRKKARLYRDAAETRKNHEVDPVHADLPDPKFRRGDRVKAIAGPYNGRRGVVLENYCERRRESKLSVLVKVEFREIGSYTQHRLAHDEIITEVQRGS
jgi:transcription antitermination factor NusG